MCARAESRVRDHNVTYNSGLFFSRRILMSTATVPVVTASSYLTLHYRLAAMDGTDIVSTFGGNPATLLLGTGQLSPVLEACLIGLPEGAHQSFDMQSDEAFGPRNPELLQWIARAALDGDSKAGVAKRPKQYEIGDQVEFPAPGGGKFTGVLRALEGDSALFDFNHPLAGQPVKFEVHIISVL